MNAKAAVNLCSGAKVQQEPNLEVGGPQIVIDDSLYAHRVIVRRLDFDDQDIVDSHVDSLFSDQISLVVHRYPHFPTHSMSSGNQFALQRDDVDPIEETKAERVVDLEEGPNDRTGQS